MKVVILCGGRGTRLGEETQTRPKPMVEIGGRPIVWHIMNLYADAGFTDFVLALGYKGEFIKEYFFNYRAQMNDAVVSLATGEVDYIAEGAEDWTVGLIDTGDKTLTGGRLLRLKSFLQESGTFMLTYGDGVADLNIESLVDYHRSHGQLATITAVRPPARFGEIVLEEERAISFQEKPQTAEGWVNGGFFVFEAGIFDYLDNDQTVLEESPLERLASEGELMVYKHDGFWHPMDTPRDKQNLEDLWKANEAPWFRP